MKKIIFLIFCLISSVLNSAEKITTEININGKFHTLIKDYKSFELFFGEKSIAYLEFTHSINGQYYIDSLEVEKDYRRQKYGTFIVQYACDCFIKWGAKEIWLDPIPIELESCDSEYIETQSMLCRFYSKFGFVKDEDEGHMILKINSGK